MAAREREKIKKEEERRRKKTPKSISERDKINDLSLCLMIHCALAEPPVLLISFAPCIQVAEKIGEEKKKIILTLDKRSASNNGIPLKSSQNRIKRKQIKSCGVRHIFKLQVCRGVVHSPNVPMHSAHIYITQSTL